MINPKNLIRGSIWLVDLNPTIGHEQAKKRPCLIVSADSYNAGPAGLVVIMPITTKQRTLYWYIVLNQSETGLDKTSYVICDQIRTVSLKRFVPKCLGFVNSHILEQVEERMRVLLYLVPEKLL